MFQVLKLKSAIEDRNIQQRKQNYVAWNHERNEFLKNEKFQLKKTMKTRSYFEKLPELKNRVDDFKNNLGNNSLRTLFNMGFFVTNSHWHR